MRQAVCILILTILTGCASTHSEKADEIVRNAATIHDISMFIRVVTP